MKVAVREGWLVLIDADGNEVSSRVAVLDVDGQLLPAGLFDVEVTDPQAAAAVRYIDADGSVSDTPLP